MELIMDKGINLKRANMGISSGLLSDEDVRLLSIRFVNDFDYSGTREAVPAVKVELERVDGGTSIEYYTIGKASDWAPIEGGCGITPIGKATQLPESSNWGVFWDNLINCAPEIEEYIENDISVLDGLEGHVLRMPAPKRAGLSDKKKSDREATILLFTAVTSLPFQKGKKGGKTTAVATAKGKSGKEKMAPKTEQENSEDMVEDEKEILKDLATKFLLDTLPKYPNGVAMSKLPILGYEYYKSNDSVNPTKLAGILYNQEFLKSNPLWQFNDGVVSVR